MLDGYIAIPAPAKKLVARSAAGCFAVFLTIPIAVACGGSNDDPTAATTTSPTPSASPTVTASAVPTPTPSPRPRYATTWTLAGTPYAAHLANVAARPAGQGGGGMICTAAGESVNVAFVGVDEQGRSVDIEVAVRDMTSGSRAAIVTVIPPESVWKPTSGYPAWTGQPGVAQVSSDGMSATVQGHVTHEGEAISEDVSGSWSCAG